MGASFLVPLREAFGAGLLLGIIYTYLESNAARVSFWYVTMGGTGRCSCHDQRPGQDPHRQPRGSGGSLSRCEATRELSDPRVTVKWR